VYFRVFVPPWPLPVDGIGTPWSPAGDADDKAPLFPLNI